MKFCKLPNYAKLYPWHLSKTAPDTPTRVIMYIINAFIFSAPTHFNNMKIFFHTLLVCWLMAAMYTIIHTVSPPRLINATARCLLSVYPPSDETKSRMQTYTKPAVWAKATRFTITSRSTSRALFIYLLHTAYIPLNSALGTWKWFSARNAPDTLRRL